MSAASAQSSVSISGLLDFGVNNGETTTQSGSLAATTVKTTKTGEQNSFSTGQISFSGTEDLGGGLKAAFVFNSGITTGSSIGDRDKYLALSGGFGSVRIGRFIPAAGNGGLFALSGAPSSGVGSIYDISTSTKKRLTSSDGTGGSFDRSDNNIQYTSPSVSGLTLNVNYGSATSDSSALLGKTDATQTGVSVTFANGPLVVAAGINSRTNDKQEVSGGAAASESEADMNWVGASYNLGAAKLFASYAMREDKSTTSAVTTTSNDIDITSLGVAVPMGAYTFNASTYTGKNDVTADATDNIKLSGYQISARYALSKRTSAYALIGENQIKRDSGNTTGAAFKETVTMFGLIHTF